MQKQPVRRLICVLIAFVSTSLASELDTDKFQSLPILGDETSAVLSPYQETQIGRAFLMQIRSALPLVNDPLIKYFTKKNINRVGEYSDLRTIKLHPVVINSDRLNAFAAPGGVIGIYLGLFLFAEDVHEYSSVVAHELAHLSQRHYARRLAKQKNMTFQNIVGFMTSAAMIAAGATDQGIATMLGTQAYLESQSLKYSRTQEREADRIGLVTLKRANFDPLGASRMFERMQAARRFQEEPKEYLSTHPITQSRIADMRNHAPMVGTTTSQSSAEFGYIKSRAEVSFVENPRQAAEGYRTQDNPYALALVLSAANEHDEALQLMRSVFDKDPESIVLSGSYAELLIRADRPEEALELLARKLEDYPNNEALSMFYIQALNKAERHAEATALLWRQTRTSPNDQSVWILLAETAGLAQKIVDVHRARAEVFALRGNFRSAVTQLRLAKNLAEDNNRLNASLDQRILDMREEAESYDS